MDFSSLSFLYRSNWKSSVLVHAELFLMFPAQPNVNVLHKHKFSLKKNTNNFNAKNKADKGLSQWKKLDNKKRTQFLLPARFKRFSRAAAERTMWFFVFLNNVKWTEKMQWRNANVLHAPKEIPTPNETHLFLNHLPPSLSRSKSFNKRLYQFFQ